MELLHLSFQLLKDYFMRMWCILWMMQKLVFLSFNFLEFNLNDEFYKNGNLLDDEGIEEHVEFASKDNNF